MFPPPEHPPNRIRPIMQALEKMKLTIRRCNGQYETTFGFNEVVVISIRPSLDGKCYQLSRNRYRMTNAN